MIRKVLKQYFTDTKSKLNFNTKARKKYVDAEEWKKIICNV